jgi:exosortase C (VPDSG-CTERM-specific)
VKREVFLAITSQKNRSFLLHPSGFIENKMNSPTSNLSSVSSAVDANVPAAANDFVPSWRQFKGLIVFTVVLIAVFCRPLLALLEFAPHKELYSHILLIPFISGYLIWTKRREAVPASRPNRALAVLPLLAGVAVLGFYRFGLGRGWTFEVADYLAVMTLAFLCFLLSGAFIFVQRNYLKSITFPIAFLIFCVPFPTFLQDGLETFFQRGSAHVAYAMFTMVRMPVLKTGTAFLLPGFPMEVAPECSGIHSSLVLFITSLVAAYLFLETPVRRWLFVLSIIPLALLRNGFRVFTLGELGVRFFPNILSSWFHHHGGPLFFLLSLVPLFLLLVYLMKGEARKRAALANRTK